MALGTHDLRLLFDLATRRQDVADGWWWRIAAWPSAGAPDEIRYSLTLHNPDNERVLGYDNDHGYHHRHPPGAERTAYRFTSCAQLLEDFFVDVDRHLKKQGVLK
jgi:hypothetical protein